MQQKNSDIKEYEWIDSLIMSTAIRGLSDCIGPIVIYWNTIGNFVLVLIEEYTGKWWQRIFVCREEFVYDRKRIMDPIKDLEDLLYTYGSFFDIYSGEKKLEHISKGDWMDELKYLAFAGEV